MTLMRQGAPIAFASALGAGSDDPIFAPKLDITYAPRPAVSPAYSDGAQYIYGFSGTFAVGSVCVSGQVGCTADKGNIPPAAHGSETTISADTLATENPADSGGRYIRVGATLSCYSTTPGHSWWSSSDQNAYTHKSDGTPVDPDHFNIGSVLDILAEVANINNSHGNPSYLIPVVNLLPDISCTNYATPGSFYSQARDFVSVMDQYAYSASRPIYFEIGNEENFYTSQYGSGYGNGPGYAQIFSSAAQGIREMYESLGYANTNYHVLTGGTLQPSVNTTCLDPTQHNNLAYYVQPAIAKAQTSPYNMSTSHLGVAAHPYKYQAPDQPSPTGYWRNYYYRSGRSPSTSCYVLRDLINLWTGDFPGMPVVFTEHNWTDSTANKPFDHTVAEGTYLVDLLTYMKDQGYNNASNSPIRDMIFRGLDAGTNIDIGVYIGNGNDKSVDIPMTYTTSPASPYPNVTVNGCNNGPVIGSHSLASNYYYLRDGNCY